MLTVMLLLPGFAISPAKAAPVKTNPTATTTAPRPVQDGLPKIAPTKKSIMVFAPVNFEQAAMQEALEPAQEGPTEIKAIDAPRSDRPVHGGVPLPGSGEEEVVTFGAAEEAPVPSVTGQSPSPSKTFKGEFLTSTSIPPDTMGAVGDNHIVTVSNDRMRIQTRDGVEISRVTLSSFWAGVALEGGAAVSAFDPKIMYDRFSDRYIFISSANAQTLSSAALFAVSQTSDPTGAWNRYAVDADPTATATGGLWIDYPSMGFNKNWIVVHENTFGYGTITGYQRSDIYVLDKQAAYSNTLSTISTFSATTSTCTAPFEGKLGCGFTMSPTRVEDNTTESVYLVEDWDSQFGQLRLSRIDGTPSAPLLTVGTQFPQSPNSWRFNAARISGTSGGYAPQRQQSANLPSGTRIMTNDSRIQNAVLRNGTLWTTHTVMLSSVPTPAGTAVGGAANPDNHSAVQWWQIDPTLVDAGTGTPPLQRGRIEDPTANNCHNGSGGLSTVPTCDTTAEQVGEFFAYPNIAVNQNNDALIGYTKFSPLTYPNAGYSVRLAADPPNTMRDQVVFRPGQANYNLGAGSGTARQNRWGDYSASMPDPINDTDFWTNQEYAGTVRDFGIGLAGNWETWWALVKPSAVAPSTSGNLIISEFRLRGPQGVRDEFVELYNPGSTPVIVNTTDNSDGWSLVKSNDGTAISAVFAVIPNGTVIPARGHFLVANNPDGATAPTLVYSLNAYPSLPGVRGADSDVGYSLDLTDTGGIALFRTATAANYNAATRMDSVGFAAAAAGLFKEGAGIPDITATTPAGQMTFVRNMIGSGTSNDTNDNATDFLFLDPVNETLGVQPKLGAAGPQNLDGPINRTGFNGIAVETVNGSSGNVAPNRVRKLCGVAEECDPNRSALGTLSIRRRITNNTDSPVTRVRFRIVDVTTLNNRTAGEADLRAITSSQTVDGIYTIEGTTLEQPPTQALGGGLNATLSANTINLSAPLAPGASTNVQLLTGVQTGGSFRFLVIIEALP